MNNFVIVRAATPKVATATCHHVSHRLALSLGSSTITVEYAIVVPAWEGGLTKLGTTPGGGAKPGIRFATDSGMPSMFTCIILQR